MKSEQRSRIKMHQRIKHININALICFVLTSISSMCKVLLSLETEMQFTIQILLHGMAIDCVQPCATPGLIYSRWLGSTVLGNNTDLLQQRRQTTKENSNN